MSKSNRLARFKAAMSSAASNVGITQEPMQPVVENLTVTEVSSRLETVNVTSQSGMPSGLDSMDEVKEPVTKPEKKYLPGVVLKGTDCCGMHILSGFQYTKTPDVEALIMGIEKAYRKNTVDHQAQREANRKAEITYFTANPNGRGPIPYPFPYDNLTPQHIAGMIVFTWNSVEYDHAAKKVAEFIKANSLGECSMSGKVVNPNSHNQIEAMIWKVSGMGYSKFVNARKDWL